jgi:uncharacterized radical SAM protein YgiQ
MSSSPQYHLPMTAEECRRRGWDWVDIVLVTGDAYVDHPSFGIAIIGRLLESHGYRVAILSQPRYHDAEDFLRFGKPRLFFGITAGNLDSIVANYTGNGKVRDHDAYSTDGNPWWPGPQAKTNRKRPDRASIVYANLARAAFSDVPVVQGGVEASLRRFVHYDYKQHRLRGSVLTDAKADLLIYGMAEKTVLAAARNRQQGLALNSLHGSCERLTESQFNEFRNNLDTKDIIYLPSWDEIKTNPSSFMDAELLIDKHARQNSAQTIVQKQQSAWVVQHPAHDVLSGDELDMLYSLPFMRTPHPLAGDVPAYRMICHSITIVRGCAGNCSFCAITRHQGSAVSSRSKQSIMDEAESVTQMDDFSGTISDLGGPTANLYGTRCRIGGCKKHDCLYPKVCEHLDINENAMLDLLNNVSSLAKVKHVFVSSGLRMELLLKTPALLDRLITSHTPGSLKIAPEHTEKDVLRLMHKESHDILKDLVKQCKKIGQSRNRKVELTPYIITGHPGSNRQSAINLVKKLKELGLTIRQFQDFTATPGTISTAMQVSGKDRKGNAVTVPSTSEKKQQRHLLEQEFHKRSGSAKRKPMIKKKGRK